MYTIQIVGAGYLGARIAEFFVEKKQKVFALTRSAAKAEKFRTQGIQPVVADLTRPETLLSIPPAHFIVICPAPDESTEAAYKSVYLDGVKNYLKAIQKNPGPSLIVYVSSTGVWKNQKGDFFDETVEPRPVSGKAKILLEAEKQVLNCGLPAAVLRLSGIYGPGRNRIAAFQRGEWPFPGADRWMNLIHVEDIVQALPNFFKNAQTGEVYLGTDDESVRISVVAEWLAKETGIKRLFSFECGEAGRRLKNDKLKSLGVCLKYPTFREGYLALIKKESK